MIQQYLNKMFFLKRWLVERSVRKAYIMGFKDGQKIIYSNTLKGDSLKTFTQMLHDCGVKLTYSERRGGVIISARSSRLYKLNALIKFYEENLKKEVCKREKF